MRGAPPRHTRGPDLPRKICDAGKLLGGLSAWRKAGSNVATVTQVW